jgi:hypothetical protein
LFFSFLWIWGHRRRGRSIDSKNLSPTFSSGQDDDSDLRFVYAYAKVIHTCNAVDKVCERSASVEFEKLKLFLVGSDAAIGSDFSPDFSQKKEIGFPSQTWGNSPTLSRQITEGGASPLHANLTWGIVFVAWEADLTERRRAPPTAKDSRTLVELE